VKLGHWYGWLLDRWDALRESYWFFPGQMALLAGGGALAAIAFDRRAPPDWMAAAPWLTQLSAAGARSVLSTIAGSMMTVISVVFSITVVALTLTSSQFGPRLLRTFLRDRASQVALGTFVATFFYSLLVLCAVETPGHVPYAATAGAVLLAIASLFVLIFFVHHAASSIQASSVIASVVREIDAHLPILFPETLGEEREAPPGPRDQERLARLDRDGLDIPVLGEGYVRILDAEALLALARDHQLLVRVYARPGRFVTAGSVIARVAPADRASEEIQDRVRECCIVGDHRTPVQDLGFLIDQLAEMAVRALSPGVSDPKTAVDCVQRLGGVIAQLARRSMPSGLRFDPEGVLRVVAEPTRFEAITASCLDPIRRQGAHDPQVATALLEAVEAGARPRVDEQRRRVLEEHAREIHQGFVNARRGDSRRDLGLVEAAFERTLGALHARSRTIRTAAEP